HDREDTYNDEKIIRNFCQENNIPILVLDVKKEDYINIPKTNLQSKYRQIRFDFFEKIALEKNMKNIMIGHNLDDNLETMYMQLLKRKTPLFYGLTKHSTYNNLNIFRPLLNK
ncbi:MAG: ATP-binding protein, partial [Clostridia bacterium]